MRYLTTLLAAGLFIAFAGDATAHSPVITDPAVTDPVPDAKHPTANKQLLVLSGGVGMNALFLLASGAGPKPTLVLLHGLPGNERNLDLAQAVRRAGWNVLTFTYRGSWGSPGKFSISNSVEDAAAAVAYLKKPDVAVKYGVDPARIVIGGHSMGGFAAAQYAAGHHDIMALLLIDAWNVGTEGKQVRGIAAQNVPLAKAIRDAGAKQLSTAHFPTDHAFGDHRIALARAVVAWLDGLNRRPQRRNGA